MHPEPLAELTRSTAIADERLRQLTLAGELAGVGHWKVSHEGSLGWCPEIFRIYGRDPANGQPSVEEAVEAFHPDDRARVARVVESALNKGEAYDFQARLVRPDGSIRVVISAGRPEVDRDGNRCVVGVFQDITERVEEQELLERTRRLASLGQVAAGVAHEINNPLAYMETNLKAAIRMCGEPNHITDLREVLSDCLDGVARIQTVVADLGTLSNVRLGTEHVNLNRVVESAVHLTAPYLKPSTKLVVELGSPRPVKASELQLSQVVINLIRNADQAFPPNQAGEIRVSTFRRNEMSGITVADDGPGVPNELAIQVFEPFFTTKEPGEGTGLGLALSAEIARRHGGRLSLEAGLNGGASFQLTLPSLETLEIESKPPEGDGPPLTKARVLIIDDEVALLAAYSRLMAPSPCEVVTAASGAEAVEILAADQLFDLIICDLVMPKMDGPALYEIIQERWPDLGPRTVFSSGAAMTKSARAFVERTQNTCMGKPVRPRQIQTLVLEKAQACP